MHTTATHTDFSGSLLDRLSNRSTVDVAQITVSRGELQTHSLRESILRNLGWLLNTTRLDSSHDLSQWPEIRRSVLNFGVPEFSGRILTGIETAKMERELTEAIRIFEPRLRSASVTVKVTANGERCDPRAIEILVSGECLEHNHLMALQIRARIDLENGRLTQLETT